MADTVGTEIGEGKAPLSRVSFEQRLRWYEAYALDKADEIRLAKRDRRYYDGIQWTADEVSDFQDRGQPIVTYNRIQPKMNHFLGLEIETRVDPEAYPRTPQHEDSRGAVTDALRYVDDKVQFDSTRSFCTEDNFIQGRTAVVVGIDENGKHITRRVRWRNMVYDPASLEPDFSDAKYCGVALWWDLDDAIDEHGEDRREMLEQAVALGGIGGADHPTDHCGMWVDAERKRLLIVELYWREGKQWWVSHTCYAGDVAEPEPVPFVDEDGESWCPWIGTSCYVVQEDEIGEGPNSPIGQRYGLARNWISPQDEINHRRSRALHDSNVYGAVYEESAIENVRSFLAEMAKPGGMAKVRDGALVDGRIQLREPGQIADGQLALMQEAKAEIDAAGPTIPVTGGDESVLSGRAILAKQSVGMREIRRPLDNIRQWQRRIFKAWWYLIRDRNFGWREEMWLRVRDSRMKEGYRFVPVNRVMTRAERVQDLLSKDVPFESAIRSVGLQAGEGEMVLGDAQQMAQQQVQQAMQMQAVQSGQPPQVPEEQLQQMVAQQAQALAMQHPIMQEQFIENDLAQLCMDIIIEETPDTTIAAQEETMELMEFGRNSPWMQSEPQLVRAFMKSLVENTNLRSKQSLLEALEEKPDPQQQQMAQMQMQQMQMAMQQMQAQIESMQADIQLTMAKAQTEQAKAQIQIPAEAQRDQADALSKAASAGEKAGSQPPMMGGV